MKDTQKMKNEGLKRRHRRVRKKIHGTGTRPRLVVYRSLKHVRAQLVDDEAGKTLAQVSSTGKAMANPSGDGSLKMRASSSFVIVSPPC